MKMNAAKQRRWHRSPSKQAEGPAGSSWAGESPFGVAVRQAVLDAALYGTGVVDAEQVTREMRGRLAAAGIATWRMKGAVRLPKETRSVYDFIVQFALANSKKPTMDQIVEHVGSDVPVQLCMKQLSRQGYFTRMK